MARVLVIAPHMDDEVLGCGATIARHVDASDQVTVCVVCNRAYDSQYDATAIAQEKASAWAAKSILGYDELKFLDFPDERLYANFQETLHGVEKIVLELQPEVVYTCFAGDLHQDHRIVAHISNIILRAHAVPSAKRILAYEVPSGTDMSFPGTAELFAPNVFVDIEKQLDRKIAAMGAYQRESRDFPHPRSPEMLRARSHTRGLQCGLASAEAFVLLRETVINKCA